MSDSNLERNRFDRMEWAGAFGDLGTFIPFVVAYITVLKMDPVGVLFAFGIAMIACGAYFKTPFPVQPMKAIGAIAATQAAQTAVITPSSVYCASLVTGLLWLALGLTGATGRIVKLVPRTVIVGIVLGLGLSFMLEGIKMMQTGWLIAAIGLFGTLMLLTNRANSRHVRGADLRCGLRCTPASGSVEPTAGVEFRHSAAPLHAALQPQLVRPVGGCVPARASAVAADSRQRRHRHQRGEQPAVSSASREGKHRRRLRPAS